MAFPEDGPATPTHDQDEFESQVGRDAPAPMSDQAFNETPMPWSSYAGSWRDRESAAPASSSAGGRPVSVMLGLSSRRGSRMASASPSQEHPGRTIRLASESRDSMGVKSIEAFDVDEIDDDELDARLRDDMEQYNSSYEVLGESALVSTQQATSRQWLETTLEKEAFNFLAYLERSLQQKQAQTASIEAVQSVTFEELIPHEEDRMTYVVAAQGLLHVLLLATKGLIEVQQQQHFGEIVMNPSVSPITE